MLHVIGMGRAKIKKFKITSAALIPLCSITRSPQRPAELVSGFHSLLGGLQRRAVAKKPAIHRAIDKAMVTYESSVIVL
jgi:hypothetical protein